MHCWCAWQCSASQAATCAFCFMMAHLNCSSFHSEHTFFITAVQISASMSWTSVWWVGVAPIPSGSDSCRTIGDCAQVGIAAFATSGNCSLICSSSAVVRGATRVFSSVMVGQTYFLVHSSHASASVMSPKLSSAAKIRLGVPSVTNLDTFLFLLLPSIIFYDVPGL